jgi:hypothetical protein
VFPPDTLPSPATATPPEILLVLSSQLFVPQVLILRVRFEEGLPSPSHGHVCVACQIKRRSIAVFAWHASVFLSCRGFTAFAPVTGMSPLAGLEYVYDGALHLKRVFTLPVIFFMKGKQIIVKRLDPSRTFSPKATHTLKACTNLNGRARYAMHTHQQVGGPRI